MTIRAAAPVGESDSISNDMLCHDRRVSLSLGGHRLAAPADVVGLASVNCGFEYRIRTVRDPRFHHSLAE
jgi:hypothetical protein